MHCCTWRHTLLHDMRRSTICYVFCLVMICARRSHANQQQTMHVAQLQCSRVTAHLASHTAADQSSLPTAAAGFRNFFPKGLKPSGGGSGSSSSGGAGKAPPNGGSNGAADGGGGSNGQPEMNVNANLMGATLLLGVMLLYQVQGGQTLVACSCSEKHQAVPAAAAKAPPVCHACLARGGVCSKEIPSSHLYTHIICRCVCCCCCCFCCAVVLARPFQPGCLTLRRAAPDTHLHPPPPPDSPAPLAQPARLLHLTFPLCCPVQATLSPGPRSQEISFQEFQTALLAKGQVCAHPQAAAALYCTSIAASCAMHPTHHDLALYRLLYCLLHCHKPGADVA